MPSADAPRLRLGTLVLTAAAAAGGTFALLGGGAGLVERRALADAPAPAVAIAEDDLTAAESLSRAFAAVSERIGPAVVSIDSVQTVTAQPRPRMPFPFFEDFERGQPDQEPREFRRGGQGSGFVVRSDGYIVTNNHVVDGADELTVRLSDGRSFEADVVGTDPQSDLAVLRVEATGLTTISFADPESLRVGQWVVAAGNPFGLGSTITAGIVSATGRGIGINRYENFIQTDAAINPGNSGGPLLNLRGEVVGVNTAIFSRTGGNVGIGFAIPVDLVEPVIEQLIDAGTVRRGYLGVLMQPLNDALARRLRFDGEGVVVSQVVEDGPAAEAGLEPLDVVVAVDGEPVDSPAQLGLAIGSRQPGDAIELRIVRDRRERTIRVELAELTEEVLAGGQPQRRPGPERDRDRTAEAQRTFGLELQPLTEELAGRLGLEGLEGGLVIGSVRPGSPADEAGLAPRMVIVEAENRTVRTAEDWAEAVEAADREAGMLLSVRAGEASRFVVLEFPAED